MAGRDEVALWQCLWQQHRQQCLPRREAKRRSGQCEEDLGMRNLLEYPPLPWTSTLPSPPLHQYPCVYSPLPSAPPTRE